MNTAVEENDDGSVYILLGERVVGPLDQDEVDALEGAITSYTRYDR